MRGKSEKLCCNEKAIQSTYPISAKLFARLAKSGPMRDTSVAKKMISDSHNIMENINHAQAPLNRPYKTQIAMIPPVLVAAIMAKIRTAQTRVQAMIALNGPQISPMKLGTIRPI
jgi:hypothetical protein